MTLPGQQPVQNQPKATSITQPVDNEKSRRELEYRQQAEYLKKLFPQLEKLAEWQLNALKARIDILMAQREEADWFVEGLDEAINPEEDENG